MNTSEKSTAFTVEKPIGHAITFEHEIEWLLSTPRLPVDLILILIQIRKKLGWTTKSMNANLQQGIGEKTDNPLMGQLIANEGIISASVDCLGLSAEVKITAVDHVVCLSVHDLRELFELPKPFMPSMTEPGWEPPGSNDPFMPAQPERIEKSPEIGWSDGFVMPEQYMRMGQAVNADMWGCENLPHDLETMFTVMIGAAHVIRVSIMGVICTYDNEGNLHGSLAISESDMELVVYLHGKYVSASFFTCGTSNPRPAIDALHIEFDPIQTDVTAMVRGKDVPFFYKGLLLRGGQTTVWE